MTRILVLSGSFEAFSELQDQVQRSMPFWELEHASDVLSARDALQERQFDFAVCDILFRDDDQADLLDELSIEYPSIVRIVLCDDEGRGVLLRSLGVAHQFLTKPCSAKELIETVFRAQLLRHLLCNPNLQSLLTRATHLPSLPRSYMKIVELLNQDDYVQASLIEVLSSDMAISAQVLKAANSAFFGKQRRVSNLLDAVTVLGTNAIKTIVLSAEAFAGIDKEKAKRFSLDRLWDHALTVASYSSTIAVQNTPDVSVRDDALTAGVLHDIGKLILIDNLPDDYEQVLLLAQEEDIPSFEAETRVFGVSHQEVGAYLLGLWGLPDGIVETVAYHHQPLLCIPDTGAYDAPDELFDDPFDEDALDDSASSLEHTPGCSLLAFVAAANIIARDTKTDIRSYSDQIELEEFLSRLDAEEAFEKWKQLLD